MHGDGAAKGVSVMSRLLCCQTSSSRPGPWRTSSPGSSQQRCGVADCQMQLPAPLAPSDFAWRMRVPAVVRCASRAAPQAAKSEGGPAATRGRCCGRRERARQGAGMRRHVRALWAGPPCLAPPAAHQGAVKRCPMAFRTQLALASGGSIRVEKCGLNAIECLLNVFRLLRVDGHSGKHGNRP